MSFKTSTRVVFTKGGVTEIRKMKKCTSRALVITKANYSKFTTFVPY
jgi:hypothetical protein